MSNGNRGYFRRLRDFWFPDWASLAWFALGLPALYFFQTAVHEGSHAFTALASTGSFPKVAPFPHLTPDGRFLNGVTFAAGGFIATPQFVDLALVIVLALVGLFWPIRNPYVRHVLRLWFLGVCVDLCYNTARELVGGHNPYADWSRFQDDLGIADGWMIVITVLIWLVVFSHFGWVYVSAWHRHRPEQTGFWEYRWVALILGLVSLCAVVVSLSVWDPKIVKGRVAFVLPLIVQFLATIWHGVYFCLSFRHSP